MDSIFLLVYATLAASRPLLQWLLAYLNFTLDSDIFSHMKQEDKESLVQGKIYNQQNYNKYLDYWCS